MTVHFDPWLSTLAEKIVHYRPGPSTLAQMTVQFGSRPFTFGQTVHFGAIVHLTRLVKIAWLNWTIEKTKIGLSAKSNNSSYF